MSTKWLRGMVSTLAVVGLLVACSSGGGGGGNSAKPVSNATADAGLDQDTMRSALITLDGSGSSDPEGAQLSYTWTQVYGPDVTGGTGVLTGEAPSFTSPAGVSTVIFKLVVNDGLDSAPDTLQINVMEDPANALFVDGDSGSDENGVGSRDNPYASIRRAVDTAVVGQDVYVKSLVNDARYDEKNGALEIPPGTSLYGGFGDNWIRDVDTHKTAISGFAMAARVNVYNDDMWLSGFDILAQGSGDMDETVLVLELENIGGVGHLVIRDNILTAGDVGANLATNKAPFGGAGGSFGIKSYDIVNLAVIDNVIAAGRGGDGPDGDEGASGIGGGDGDPGNFAQLGAGGENLVDSSLNGGAGGDGQTVTDLGNACIFSVDHTAQPGEDPTGGAGGGSVGDGGNGADGVDATEPGAHADLAGSGISVAPMSGAPGSDGQPGVPGSGGGGGNGSLSPCSFGGGGGGGGAAASAGRGGTGGYGGGASVAIYVETEDTNLLNIIGNTLTSGDGGNAGRGGNGGPGALGGTGGIGAGVKAPAISGGNGGRGGNSTAGGDGSGGGGGPSYGIVQLGALSAGTIENNTIATGNGGAGGDSRNGKAGEGGWNTGIVRQVDMANIDTNTFNIGDAGAGGTSEAAANGGDDGQSLETMFCSLGICR